MMSIATRLRAFSESEDGAVTVDWVVLTGLIVGLAIIVLGTASKGITGASVNVAASIQDKQAAATALNQ